METLVVGVLPIVGVAIGAYLQHWLSRSKQREDQLASTRQQAYADYLQGVAGIAHANAQERRTFNSQIADAKTRIAIYGSAAVIEQLAVFDRLGPDLSSPRSVEAFLKTIRLMRIEGVQTDTSPSDGAIQAILFGAGHVQ